MGLATSQFSLLMLTERKATCENAMAIEAMHKMALTREMSELSQEYYSRLQTKNISYYANGQYHKMDYSYLMGRGSNFSAIWNNDKYALKDNNAMILTDFKGQVVMSNDYANAIISVLGTGAITGGGVGSTFSAEKIPAILAELCLGFSEETFQTIIDGNNLYGSYTAHTVQTLTGEETGEQVVVDNTSTITEKARAIVDFYYPIFLAAAANGWTTQYNQEMALNDDYVSDALATGSFQLELVDGLGQYDEGGNLTYFITAGFVEARTDADVREEVTAWYNAQKEILSAKEVAMDLVIEEYSVELEAIKAEIQFLNNSIKDATGSIFDWGNA